MHNIHLSDNVYVPQKARNAQASNSREWAGGEWGAGGIVPTTKSRVK